MLEDWRERTISLLDIGSAWDEANDAKARLSSLNDQLAELRVSPDYDREAEKELLNKIDAAGKEAGMTWLDRFAKQVSDATAFAGLLGDLKESGLNQTLIDQIAGMGADAGTTRKRDFERPERNDRHSQLPNHTSRNGRHQVRHNDGERWCPKW